LCKVGAIAAVNAHQWESGLDWMRAARTDKGVSAFYNIISLNMLLVPDFAEKMNQVLPEDIRIFGIYQVPRSFSAKDRCGARVYEYRLPTYLFKPSPQNTRFSAADWKFDATCKDYVDEILSAFLGTHRFHNFTVKMAYKEPQTERYIMSFKCSEPYEVGGIQWVTLTVRGQSFVLHQIRKMVAVAVSVVRDGQSADVIKALFCPPKQENITMAPSEGLCLASLDYERYNAKVATEKDSTSEVIAMTNETPTIEAFRDNIVVPHLAALEKEKTIFKNWLEGWQRFPLIYSKILSVLKKPTNRADGRVSQQPTADDGLKLSSVSAEPAAAAIDVQIGKSVTTVTEGPTSSPSTLANPTPVDEPAE
jgi:tRNA pseudouridine38-40 synthase